MEEIIDAFCITKDKNEASTEVKEGQSRTGRLRGEKERGAEPVPSSVY